MKKGQCYMTDKAYVSYLGKQIRCRCPHCGHTMLRSVKHEKILCNYCNKVYQNNSRAFILKKLKEMIS